MTVHLRMILIILTIIAAWIFSVNVKHKKLELKYTLMWFGEFVILVIVLIFPEIFQYCGYILGIRTVMNTVYFLGFLMLFVIAFIATVALSRNSVRVKLLAQKVTLLEKEIREVKQGKSKGCE
ncbi:MAG: DUF2304 domain-containing protein [Fusobacteria bacterium]|nr:DUF2304 domain-containing protein [Fusobacteriota bacterium]